MQKTIFYCPDCGWETVQTTDEVWLHCGWTGDRMELTDSERHLVTGSPNSSGAVGARGRLTRVSEILDPALTDASSTPDDGLNTFQGLTWAISSPWKGPGGVGYTLTVYYDSETAGRLDECLSSLRGKSAMEGIECSPMITILELPTT